MWESFKEICSAALLIFLGLFYLAHFIAFIFIGMIAFYEGNKTILGLEIACCIAIVLLGVERLKKALRNRNGILS